MTGEDLKLRFLGDLKEADRKIVDVLQFQTIEDDVPNKAKNDISRTAAHDVIVLSKLHNLIDRCVVLTFYIGNKQYSKATLNRLKALNLTKSSSE